jgi:hypothetical protein
MKALEKGYRIIQMHEVWHFPQRTDTLFKEYIDTFAKNKLEASGYPKVCYGRAKEAVRGRHNGKSRDSIGPQQDCVQPGVTRIGKTDVEFVLG